MPKTNKTIDDDGEVFAVGIPELARRTGLSQTFLYERANEGTLPGCRRLGRRFLIHIETFANWLKAGGMGDEINNGNE